MFEVIIYIACLVGGVAVVLWSIEVIAKHVGGRRTWILLLGVVPSIAAAGIAYLNRSELVWWQVFALILSGPAAVIGVLLLAYVAFNPFVIVAFVGGLCSRFQRRFRPK